MTFLLRIVQTERFFSSFLQPLRLVAWGELIFATLLLGTVGNGIAFSETVSAAYRRPVPVELVNYIDVHNFHAGSSFFVRVANDWAGLGCFLRSGQIIEAKVELASRRGKRSGKAPTPSQLAVSFNNVPCLYNKATISLVLAAVLWDSSSAIPNSAFPMIHKSFVRTGSVSTIQGSFIVDGLRMEALKGKPGMRKPLEPEDVIGIPGVKLRIGAGPERCSILESFTRDVSLERDTAFVLVPASVAFLHPSSVSLHGEADLPDDESPETELGGDDSGLGATVHVPAAEAIAEPAREFLPCAPPACNADLPSTDQKVIGNATEAIAIGPLGYAPRPQREIQQLDEDDAVAWLGSRQLIVAFNPHKLIRREGMTIAGATVRRIHAVVLDVSSQTVVSTADWDLPDKGAYLWQLSGNRVLVHVGDQLQVLSEGLKVDTRIPMEGPLAFVRTSPNAELMAVATIHERHSAELHAKLREALSHEPDEDVQIRIFDRNFKIVAQATSSREIMPPILLNEGQVRLLASSESKYRLELLPWLGGSASVARFRSACLPSVSSFAPDLLFVTTCSQSRIHEYRVLRPDGAVVMHGNADPQNLGQEALGAGEKFAVKVLHARSAVVDGSLFHGSDLDHVEVRIYRTEDGRRVSVIQTATPPPSRGGFALSSDGGQLAILSNSRVSLYSLP